MAWFEQLSRNIDVLNDKIMHSESHTICKQPQNYFKVTRTLQNLNI